MLRRNIIICSISASISLSTIPSGAMADASAFWGGAAGAALGTIITNSAQKRYVVRKKTYRAPATTSYQREQNRQVQTSLNYFGFPAGVADGVMGRNSRSAVSQYQAFMGYPATGVLTEYERVFLTSAYQRSIVGGPQVAQTISARGMGPRGLLLAYRDEQMGVASAPSTPAPAAPVPVVTAPATVEVVAPAPTPTPTPTPTPEPEVAVAVTEPVEAKSSGALPSFLSGSAKISMASHCNRVNMATNSNGGFMTASALVDPTQALGEQFCIARTFAIEQGDSLAGTVQGFSMAEMEEQCEAFAPSMLEYQSRVATQSPAEVSAALQEFVVSTGASPAQLSGNARICLGVGHRKDNPELALAASMILVGLGEEAYGEFLGHHLINGFATPKRPDRGVEWFEIAVSALESGATPVVSVGADNRTALLRQAVLSISGAEPNTVLQDASASGGFVLPVPKESSN